MPGLKVQTLTLVRYVWNSLTAWMSCPDILLEIILRFLFLSIPWKKVRYLGFVRGVFRYNTACNLGTWRFGKSDTGKEITSSCFTPRQVCFILIHNMPSTGTVGHRLANISISHQKPTRYFFVFRCGTLRLYEPTTNQKFVLHIKSVYISYRNLIAAKHVIAQAQVNFLFLLPLWQVWMTEMCHE